MPNEPSTWWFLPWMSLAIAPPTVTKRVPGVTGTKQPRGTSTRSSSSRLTPGRHGRRAGGVVDDRLVGVVAQAQHGAAAVLRRVAVGPAQPAGDAAAAGRSLTAAAQPVDVATRRSTTSAADGAVRPQPVNVSRRIGAASVRAVTADAQYGHSGTGRPRRRASVPSPSVEQRP